MSGIMDQKYRIKLKTGRIVGPFLIDQVKDLFTNGHVDQTCSFQLFPLGDWVNISEDTQMKTLLLKMLDKKNNQSVSEDEVVFEEFNYSKSSDSENKVDYKKISENYDKAVEEDNEVEQILNETRESLDDDIEDNVDKTVIRNISHIQEKVEKTILLKKEDLAELHESNLEEVINTEEDLEEVEELVEVEKIDLDAKTQMIDLKQLMPEIKKDYKKSKKEFDKAIQSHDIEIIEEIEEPEDEEESQSLVKKQIRPIAALAIIAILWVVLFPEEEKKKALPPIWAKISFPIVKEIIDEEKAEAHLQAGLKLYRKKSYVDIYKAHVQFKKSLQYKFLNNKSAGLYILTAAEILDNIKIKNKSAASQAIYKMIRITQSKRLKDVNIATGSSLFYYKMKYYETAKILASNYLRLGKPTKNLYAIYLNILLKVGDFVNSKKVYDKLVNVKKLPAIAYLALTDYLVQNEEFEEAMKVIKAGGVSFPRSVPILLAYASLLENQQNMPEMAKVLKVIKELDSERSPIYVSRLYEKLGILKAYAGKNIEAVKFFKFAFKLHESNQLRSKLASLELGGEKNTEALILESKIIELMGKAKVAVKDHKWEFAFNYAIEACDMDEMYIPSHLLLAEIQVKRGYFNSALRTLEGLRQYHPNNSDLNYALIESYINSYRLIDAQRDIAILRKTKDELKPRTASLIAMYYKKTGNLILTLKWLAKSVSRDPLNAEEYYLTAKTYFQHRKYKKVKYNLSRALELDPLNSRYITMNARLLFELDGSDTAIGYLRKHLERDSDNPRILGEIAIYYYRSNQIKEFERMRDRIKKQGLNDEAFYEFLIQAAKLEEKDDDVMKYARELIKINPGDLDSRVVLGEYLYSRGQFSSSIEIFESVKLRLKTYPRANYYLAKAHLQLGQYDNAEEAAKLEIKSNPELENGYYILGEVLRKKEDFLGAKKNFNKAISINDKYVEALLGLGWIKMRRNYNAAAKELYLRALRESPNNPLIHRQLGRIYMNISQNVLAAESFKAYLTLYPNAHDRSEINGYLQRLK